MEMSGRQTQGARRELGYGVFFTFTLLFFYYVVTHFRPPLAVIVTAAVVAIALFTTLVLRRASWAFWLFCLIMPLYPFARMILVKYQLIGASLVLLLSRWSEFIIVFSLVGRKLGDMRRYVTSAVALDLTLIAYLGLGIVYFVLAGQKMVALWGLRVDYLFYLTYVVIRFIPVRKQDIRNLLSVVLIIGAAIAAFGCFQAQFLSEGFARFLMDEQKFMGMTFSPPNLMRGQTLGFVRAVSILGDTLSLGAYCCFLFLLLLPFLSSPAGTFWKRSHQIVALFLISACLFYTTTRAGWVGAVFGALIIAVCTRRIAKTLFIFLVVGLAGLTLLYLTGSIDFLILSIYGTEASAAGHLSKLYTGTLHMLENPWGIGLGLVGRVAIKFGQHLYGGFVSESWYLQIGNEMGIPALVLFLTITFLFIYMGFKTYRAVSDEFLKRFALGATTAYIGMALFGVFLHVWTCKIVPEFAHLFMGIVIFHVRRIDEEESAHASEPEVPPEIPDEAEAEAPEGTEA